MAAKVPLISNLAPKFDRVNFTLKDESTGVGDVSLNTRVSVSGVWYYSNEVVHRNDSRNVSLIHHTSTLPDESKWIAGRSYTIQRQAVQYGSPNTSTDWVSTTVNVPSSLPRAVDSVLVGTTSLQAVWELAQNSSWLRRDVYSDASLVQMQFATDAAFTQGVVTVNATYLGSYKWRGIGSNLLPNTTYYMRARSQAFSVWSGWSATRSAKTAQAAKPALRLEQAGGAQLRTTLVVSDGSYAADYIYEYYPPGTAAAPTKPAAGQNNQTIQGVAGVLTHVRGATRWGSPVQQGPWSDWVSIVPSNEGSASLLKSYFDGTFTASGPVSFAAVAGPPAYSQMNSHLPYGWRTVGTSGNKAPLTLATNALGERVARMYCRDRSFWGGWLEIGNVSATATGKTYINAVLPSTDYSAAVEVEPSKGLNFDLELAIYLVFYSSTHAEVGRSESATGYPEGGSRSRLRVSGRSPANAAYAAIEVYVYDQQLSPTGHYGEYLDFSQAMIVLGQLPDYFDGNTTDPTMTFVYSWEPSSVPLVQNRYSLRKRFTGTRPDPLEDPNCPTPPLPPTVPPIIDECLPIVDPHRRFWVQLPASEVTGALAQLPIVTLATTEAVRAVRVRVWANPENLPPTLFSSYNEPVGHFDISYLPAGTLMELDGLREHATAAVGAGPMLSADNRIVGPNGGPPLWPTLQCGISYIFAIDVPPSASPGAVEFSIENVMRY